MRLEQKPITANETVSVNNGLAIGLPGAILDGFSSDDGFLSYFDRELTGVSPLSVFRDIRRKLKAGFERWIYGTRELRIYVFPLEKAGKLPRLAKFNRNSIEDLLCYERTSLSQPSREHFLYLARERFSRGMISFTYAEDGVLQSYMWLDPNPESYFGSGVDQEIEVVAEAAYVQDAFTNPANRSKGIGQAGFCQLVHEAAELTDRKSLYFAIFSNNKPSRHGAEKLGAVHTRSYFCKTFLGLRKIWKIDVGVD